MPEAPAAAATPQEAVTPTKSLILDQYGNPYNQEKPKVSLLDQYGNPLPPSETVQPAPENKVTPINQVVQGPTTPPNIVQPPQQPANPARVIPVVTQAPSPAVNPSNAATINNTPATPVTQPVAPTGPVGPTGPVAPTNQPSELEQLVDRIHEYNKNGTTLSKEDFKMRRERWGEIEPLLEKKAKPVKPEDDPTHISFIENTGPTLERSRIDYAQALFNNRKALYENKDWKKSGDGVVVRHLIQQIKNT